jgi:hypothetical protein
VDNRYLAGVRSATIDASSVWGLTPAQAATAGWKVITTCTAAGVTAANLTAADRAYFDCPQPQSGITMTTAINAGTVLFNGWIAGGQVAMPNATKVYISNADSNGAQIKSNGVSLSNGNSFCVRSSSCNPTDALSTGQCPSTPTTGSAQLIIRHGSLKQTGGLLRLCNTAVVMLGGQTGACLPATAGTAPTSTPCAGGAGTGQLSMPGGLLDWTAPNRYNTMSTLTSAQQAAAWTSLEDLALWTESYGGPSNAGGVETYSMAGGGNMRTSGVFMAPNATPFSISGGGSQTLNNAQYVVSRFSLAGGANLTMTVDPANAVTLPALGLFALVR